MYSPSMTDPAPEPTTPQPFDPSVLELPEVEKGAHIEIDGKHYIVKDFDGETMDLERITKADSKKPAKKKGGKKK